MIRIQVNGEERTLPEPASLEALLEHFGFPLQPGLAAAINGQVIPQSARAQTFIQDGDRIEIIHAVAGG